MEDPFKIPTIEPKVKEPTIINEPIEIIKEIEKPEEIKVKPKQKKNIPLVPCPYVEPKWSKVPDSDLVYNLEVLKTGVILDEIKNLQGKAFWIFGRLPNCDVMMEHPTISRYHSVLQYRPSDEDDVNEEEEVAEEEKEENKPIKVEEGWYVYDLNSTHGTFVNKQRVPPKTYIRVRVGHMIHFGGSTRRYILQGPSFDEEAENELTVTELRELKVQQDLKKLELIEEAKLEKERMEKLKEQEGISWGMSEDADEETDININPYASTNNEELYLNDPKKTLRGFFEREGLEMEYKVDEMTMGTYICRVELPIDDSNGRPIVAEVCHKGKKKDSVFQCAMEACKILDRHGVLRKAQHEPNRKKITKSDSEDDDYLDRTGDVERKRQRKAATNQTVALSHKELIEQETDLLSKLSEIDIKIQKYHDDKLIKDKNKDASEDDLEDFMNNLSSDKNLDKTEIRRLRVEEQRLKTDHLKLQKLIKIAAPVALPPIIGVPQTSTDFKKKLNLPLFGKRNKLEKYFGVKKVEATTTKPTSYKSDEEEVEEEDEVKPEEKPAKVVQEEDEVKPEEKPAKVVEEEVPIKVLDPPKEIPKVENVPEVIPKVVPPSPAKKRELVEDTDDKPSEQPVQVPKKRRNRNKGREKYRENVDMDDAEEMVEEKYSKWVPPSGQAGDGFTKLNEKFGY